MTSLRPMSRIRPRHPGGWRASQVLTVNPGVRALHLGGWQCLLGREAHASCRLSKFGNHLVPVAPSHSIDVDVSITKLTLHNALKLSRFQDAGNNHPSALGKSSHSAGNVSISGSLDRDERAAGSLKNCLPHLIWGNACAPL